MNQQFRVVACLAIAWATTFAFADEKDEEETEDRFEKFKTVVFDGKQESKGQLKRGLDIKRTLTLPAQQIGETPSCVPAVSISYMQKHDRVRVDTTVVNDDCGPSAGEYMVRVRTKSESGELTTRDFTETWSRDHDEDVLLTNWYDMADDPDLVWARVRTSRSTACACAEDQLLNAEIPQSQTEESAEVAKDG